MDLEVLDGSLLVQRSDDVLARAHTGWADFAARIPCTAATRFQTASISKHFTAAAALLLVEQGAIHLTDVVTRWFAAADPRWAGISVHHLLSHTGGLGHWEDYPEIDLYAHPAADVVRLVVGRAPRGPLGQFSYSSPGYLLLAHIVQAVADVPYGAFVEERLLAPAGMADSFVGAPRDPAAVAVPQEGERRVPSFELDHVARGAGDVWSTADDVLRWDAALRGDALLTADSRQQMFGRQVEVPGSPNAYGYGWTLGTFGGRAARFHGGDNHAYRGLHVWWPEDDLRFVALTNSQLTSHERLHELAHAARALG
jgi:CubicO group peptidase (beta-lactamase class C family)